MMPNQVTLPENYEPLETEQYMSHMQLKYFKNRLLAWKSELLSESRETLNHLKEENWHEPDMNDRAAIETEATLELRTRDRYRKLIDKIEVALQKIEDTISNKEIPGYGYCEETGERIGLKRLKARPIATLSIEAQERHEKREKHYIDDRT